MAGKFSIRLVPDLTPGEVSKLVKDYLEVCPFPRTSLHILCA